ncbi:alpha-mannosidase [Amycolatopsis bartoniae]|uniref:Putative glycosyl hydrolase n=1 Tax=Amycolatopsis bartoniae TaxID=941986 RepID=A0A8H9IP94_9PSEU|nr:glycoside hydrolase family 38 C-terminal domain-containing protein [Amycolatopsis bartoniae]MBB2937839.1 alpha-mannosidase [Amycolatopsis bartoniae]TVT06500.1 alpha-mannosidase [Amycolatopsis bartoniae]GHF41111.1 putative glycosyl hydrolase [Amycolatopsis bartoniae]
MHDVTAQIEARIERFVRERVAPALERRCLALDVTAWEVPGEPVPFADAVAQSYVPFATGTPWGKPWGTTWFHVTGAVPEGWGGALEVVFDLGFSGQYPGFQAEGLVYRPDGSIVKGLEPLNNTVPVEPGPIDLYVEAASNPDVAGGYLFQPTPLGDKATAGTEPIYTLHRIDLVERDLTVYHLLRDCWTLAGLRDELDPSLPRRAEILRALERMCDVVDPDRVAETAAAGREALSGVLASPAHASAHHVIAVGHAHIDSAWLWPTRETIRKCARTFSNVLALMDEYPDFVFACSSAQQYAWIKEHYPALFERIRKRVAEGRFVPVGGMWVESDTNLPGGEALARQFVHGKGFFLREFGFEPDEVWLPDSFGYSAALPQLARAAGAHSFLTQKISWNQTNRMPHHTFWWEGIDGSRVFTHFPPTDTYNSDLSGADLARAQRQYAEKGVSNVSLTPFGFGNGGGGPTREMLEAAVRTRSLEGSPTVEIGTPQRFFDLAKAAHPAPATWSGELYLELHRGTYTSQAKTKQGNRRSEHLLREAELWHATAAWRGLGEYPYEELDAAWRTVLLQQFHDILPGSSIAWVHQEAERNYAALAETLTPLIESAQRLLAGPGAESVMFNAAPVAAAGVPALGAAVGSGPALVPPVVHDGWVLDNGVVRAAFDGAALLRSFVDVRSGRELIADGEAAALLQVFRDLPNRWDAWDLDEHYRHHVDELRTADSVTVEGDALVVRRSYRDSAFVQTFRLARGAKELDIETRIDWHEREKLLKLAFPLAVHADRASSEVQFGHVQRPTHANTSWDNARFETAAHRWVHVGEPGFGVALANDSTYGHDISRRWAADGSTVTLVRQSLLRAPRYPDPHADQGTHVLRTALRPAESVLEALDTGYRLNLPVRTVTGGGPVAPLLTVSSPAVVVEAVKLAEDRSGDLVVRLYEARGGRARARVAFSAPAGRAWTTDLLEREPADGVAQRSSWAAGEPVDIAFRPFEIVTLRVSAR